MRWETWCHKLQLPRVHKIWAATQYGWMCVCVCVWRDEHMHTHNDDGDDNGEYSIRQQWRWHRNPCGKTRERTWFTKQQFHRQFLATDKYLDLREHVNGGRRFGSTLSLHKFRLLPCFFHLGSHNGSSIEIINITYFSRSDARQATPQNSRFIIATTTRHEREWKIERQLEGERE